MVGFAALYPPFYDSFEVKSFLQIHPFLAVLQTVGRYDRRNRFLPGPQRYRTVVGSSSRSSVRETSRLTTFYPLDHWTSPILHARCASVTSIPTSPIYESRLPLQPGWVTGLFTSTFPARPSDRPRLPDRAYLAFMTAPAGITPSFRYRHSAIASLRATATIAMRLPRLFGPLPCVRWANHFDKALSGW